MAASLNCLFEADLQRGGKLSRQYDSYINAYYPPIVRITALECSVRLLLIRALTLQHMDTSTKRLLSADLLAEMFEMVIDVLKTDPCLDVRRNAALNLYNAILDRPSRSIPMALSLGEILLTYGWYVTYSLVLVVPVLLLLLLLFSLFFASIY